MPDPTLSPYLVTLGLDPSTFERLDRLRARYFPADLNVIPAHVSLFHHLPGDEGDAIGQALDDLARTSAPAALAFPEVKRTGRGVMASVRAPGLASLHARLARSFAGWLTPQDRQPFRPHVTIMNKATPADAAPRAFDELRATWIPFEGIGDGLRLWRYRGGPWEAVEEFPLAGKTADPDLDSTSTPPGG